MYQVEDPPIETIHLYVVREEEKRPPTLLPLFGAFLCLVGIAALTIYSVYNPYYEHERLTIPAHFFTRIYSATAPIIPTGIKTYPATTAHGLLTITNGSVISQTIPQGFTIDGVETDSAVFVPAGSANGYGIARVPAHALVSGKGGNFATFSINQVIGSSVYIRNLQPFIGGTDSYSVKIITPQDRQTALDGARSSVTAQVARRRDILASPCNESAIGNKVLLVDWTCQFVSYPHISIPSARITAITLAGKNLIVDVIFVPKTRRVWVK